MILWLFAVFDLFMALAIIGAHFDILPGRPLFTIAVALAGKALFFNDKFLSFLDIMAAIYMVALIFIDGFWLTWAFAIYFLYKVIVSL